VFLFTIFARLRFIPNSPLQCDSIYSKLACPVEEALQKSVFCTSKMQELYKFNPSVMHE
jgi:hypothetical protein